VLLDAYERLASREVPIPKLRIAGMPGQGSEAWLDRLRRPPLDRLVRYAGWVEDAGREALFAGARTLVLPSLDEGFGLPVLEAMSAGIPVIAAKRGALPEVVGHAGLLFDAEDPEELAAHLQLLATDRQTALACAHAGLEQARHYQWSRTASAVHAAYQDAIERRAGRPVPARAGAER
jgi:glycosyltransferase involved in cell wall biosynthesis